MKSISASDALVPEWFETYVKQRDAIGDQLIQLNHTIFLIEKIEAFPFSLFLPLFQDRVFWYLTKNALVERTILIISRVAIDVGDESLTIRHFKNEVMKHLGDPATKVQLQGKLRSVEFDKKIEVIASKVEHIRNNHVAHFDKERAINSSSTKEVAISLKELKESLSLIVDLFDALCFDTRCSLWYWGYSDNIRARQDTDIDRLLDSVARNSHLLNMPEQQPEFWKLQRSQYLEKELETLNAFRRKFNLPEG